MLNDPGMKMYFLAEGKRDAHVTSCLVESVGASRPGQLSFPLSLSLSFCQGEPGPMGPPGAPGEDGQRVSTSSFT